MAENLIQTAGPLGATAAEPTVTPASPPGYELLDEIGRGGMGVVYRARDVALDRDVAVKLPSAVLLDMMMSEVDGWQLLKMLRNNPDLLHVPVIIVTGLGIANLEWAKSLGAVGLVQKPIDAEQLKDSLARVFGSGTDLQSRP